MAPATLLSPLVRPPEPSPDGPPVDLLARIVALLEATQTSLTAAQERHAAAIDLTIAMLDDLVSTGGRAPNG